MNRNLKLLLILCALLVGCTMGMGDSRYGNYGGPARAPEVEKPFSIAETNFGVRWFPAYVRYSPDDTNLLVSLCHTSPGHASLCRIGRYHIASGKWEILPYEDKRTYRWPTYTPDGKWIVFSTGPCDEQYRCSAGDYVLARLPADGSRVETVADTIAREPSFAADGKKLVYWRLGPAYGVRGRGALVSKLYEMDWETRQERELLSLTSSITYDVGRPFLIDGGKAVVFYGTIDLGNEPVRQGLMRIEIGDKPFQTTSDLYRELKVIWPGGRYIDTPPYSVSAVFDMSRDGKVLYSGSLERKKRADESIAKSIRPAQPRPYPKGIDGSEMILWDGRGSALFLRSLIPDAMDETGFDIPFCFVATLSPDAKRVAFIDGSPTSYHPNHKSLAIISVGERKATYIDWPRLELKPGRN